MQGAENYLRLSQHAFDVGDYSAVVKFAAKSLDVEYSLLAFKYFCLGNVKLGNFAALENIIDSIDDTELDLKVVKFDYYLWNADYDDAAELAKRHYEQMGIDHISKYFRSAFLQLDRSESKNYASWTQQRMLGPGEVTYWQVVGGDIKPVCKCVHTSKNTKRKIYIDLTATFDHLKESGSPTGIQRASLLLATSLYKEAQNEFDVRVIYLSRNTSKFIEFSVNLILNWLNDTGNTSFNLLKSLESWTELFAPHNPDFLRYEVHEAEFAKHDIVLFPDVIWGPYFRNISVVKTQTQCKVLCVVHDIITIKDVTENAAEKYNFAFRKSIDFTIENADLILVPSNATRVDLLKYCIQKSKEIKLRTIGWGVCDISGFNNRELEADVLRNHPGTNFWLSVGSLSRRKNFARSARAFLRLSEELPNDLKFAFCGRWNSELSEYHEMQDIIKDSEGKVVHLGVVSDTVLRSLYQECNALVLLSLDEGWGLPVSEVMTFRKPLLLSDYGALPEVAGDVAQYANAYSVEDIAEKMKLLLCHDERRRMLIEYDKISNRGWEKVSLKLLKAISEIL